MSREKWVGALSICFPMLFYWVILLLGVPISITRYFFAYSSGLFLVVLISYYISFRLPNQYGVLASLGLTMLLLAFTLSFKWSSGYSNNEIIGGLLPYKDGNNYYMGSTMILNGVPLVDMNQATERPLFPGFIASILFITGHNLKTTVAAIFQLVGIGIYLSARQVHRSYGALASGLFASFLYFYIQPMVGHLMSETLGVLLGCLAFTLMWISVGRTRWQNLALATFVLMVGVSARAGTFFIFPALALWMGWALRSEKRFSWKVTIIALGGMVIGYILVNSIFARLVGIPPGSSFGNFSYALYGQVRGGAGWHSAIEDLGTRDPSIVYRAAFDFFLDHPISLFIGFAKSYRDFFLAGDPGIFPFGNYTLQNAPGIALWLATLYLLIRGGIHLISDIRSSHSSLLLAGFVGIVLSIPFLPPIDGGARFYASATPFFFVLPAMALSLFLKKIDRNGSMKGGWAGDWKTPQIISIVALVLTMIMPVVLYTARSSSQISDHGMPQCQAEQEPFVIEFHPGSYIDLVENTPSRCHGVPSVCFDDFISNNPEKGTDDFYRELIDLTKKADSVARIIPAVDWLENKPHYFYLSNDKLRTGLEFGLLSGCAIQIRTKYQSIYKVESLILESN